MPYISLGKLFLEYIFYAFHLGRVCGPLRKCHLFIKFAIRRCRGGVGDYAAGCCRAVPVRPGGRSGSAALAVAGAGGGVQLDCCVASQSSCRAAALAVAESGGGGVLQDLSVASLLCRSGSQHSGVCQSDAAGYHRRAR